MCLTGWNHRLVPKMDVREIVPMVVAQRLLRHHRLPSHLHRRPPSPPAAGRWATPTQTRPACSHSHLVGSPTTSASSRGMTTARPSRGAPRSRTPTAITSADKGNGDSARRSARLSASRQCHRRCHRQPHHRRQPARTPCVQKSAKTRTNARRKSNARETARSTATTISVLHIRAIDWLTSRVPDFTWDLADSMKLLKKQEKQKITSSFVLKNSLCCELIKIVLRLETQSILSRNFLIIPTQICLVLRSQFWESDIRFVLHIVFDSTT